MLTLPPVWAEQTASGTQAYSIPAGKLRDALDAFAAQSDIQIVYAPELAQGKTTRGLSGQFTSIQALGQLLAGTGLTWTEVNAFTFMLKPSPVFRSAPGQPARQSINTAPETLGAVTVSGSLIRHADIQTATPTSTITAADIHARGFNSLAEVLQNSVLATGSLQGPQFAGSFTQGAQPVSLFGLGPQFTLILLDGKPIADFGRLYNGTTNFSSVSNFPLAIIDHIDVMPGGASPIYGSQAIGGVINIVTKSHFNGSEVSVRTGGYTDGGGASQRISAIYGHDTGAWQVLGVFEFDNMSPIWGYQRQLTAGSGPGSDSRPSLQAGILDYGTRATYTGSPLGYLAPPDGCATGLFGGSTTLVKSASPHPPGAYCGSSAVGSYSTYSNQLRNFDGMAKLAYRLSDHMRLYAHAMVNWQTQRWFPSVSNWFPDDFPHGVIEDAASGHLLYLEKFFAPEEMPGGAAGQMDRQQDLLYQFNLGANGQWGDSDWNWDAYYLRTGDRTTVVSPLLIASSVDAFFSNLLGPVAGTDPHNGVNLYHPDYPAFFRPVTPAQYASFSRNVLESSNTWINDGRITLSNASLFALPGGDAGFATLLEGGSEAWYQPVNSLYTQGDVFEHAATGGGGRRSHAAAAFEWNLPLARALTIDLSGRYDYYALDRGGSNHKFTYKAGIEYRPVNALLFRGNYTTSFKVPDLSSTFLGPTNYYTIITDYYQCAVAHGTPCGTAYQYNIRGTSLANPHLQPTSAQSWTLGTVWSPTDRLDVSLDYLHIAIENEVVQQDVDLLMHTDAQCLLGQRSATSAECQMAASQVQRVGGRGPVTGISTYYANLANEVTKSITGGMRYRFALARAGKFDLQLDYNNMLKHAYQIAPGTLPINLLANPVYSTEFKSILSGSLGWTSPDDRWSSTLYGHRYGPSPNFAATNEGFGYAGTSHLSPWIVFNMTATYRPTRRLALSLLVNNLANKMPPSDSSDVFYPYFNIENYNIYGREIMLQLDMRLGHAVQ